MSKGVLLFAFNTTKYDYYKMAVYTAKRINALLDLPVTVVTDKQSITDNSYTFDRVITTTADTSNKRDWGIWINKGRFQAFDLSPYDETILLDTDYLVNSNQLLTLFKLTTDFCCHNKTSFLMQPNAEQEVVSMYSFITSWATVVKFSKTKRAEQIFQSLEMIQKNFGHYANIHGFIPSIYRNDYGLTLAAKIVNGHLDDIKDTIPWNLVHVGMRAKVSRIDDTSYLLMNEVTQRAKTKKEYIIIKDTDFHMLNKDNFMELI